MKVALILPEPDAGLQLYFLLACLFLFGLLWGVQFFRSRKSKKSFWIASLFLILSGAGAFIPFLHGFFGIFFALFALRKKPEESPPPAKEPEPLSEEAVAALKRQNEILRRRIQEMPETFFSQAKFFECYLTLNEIQLIHGLVESLSKFLHAKQASFYQYSKNNKAFYCVARYNTHQGWEVNASQEAKDRILYLILESTSTLSIREILHNDMLYKIWGQSDSKALIYCPVYQGKQFFGILTIDELPVQHLNRQTVRNAKTAAKLAGLAFRNIRAYQKLLVQRNKAQSQLLTEYQQFLRSFNMEFKRAQRNQIPLSLLLIAIEPQRVGSSLKVPPELFMRIKESIRKNLREIDMVYEDDHPGLLWVILPHTDFNGLAYVMERLNLIIHLDLAEQADFSCRFGFSFIQSDYQMPKQMLYACQESLQLHRTVEEIIARKKTKTVLPA